MRSMTGFGRAELQRDGIQVTAEIRTLNQRFFELKLNLPRGWVEHEAQMRKLVQSVVARGRVEAMVRYSVLKPLHTRLVVNHELAAHYVAEMRRLGKRLGLSGDLSVDAILQRPEIFKVIEEETADPHPAVSLALRALKQALKAVASERNREGESLRHDFVERIAKIERTLPRVAKLSDAWRADTLQNFHKRMKELLGELPLNEKRLYEEASSTAQHGDISEELTRLRTHLSGLKRLVGKTGTVGKEIEFLLQEVNREVNTISAKSQSAQLAQATVELKNEVEKMREQVQNIE